MQITIPEPQLVDSPPDLTKPLHNSGTFSAAAGDFQLSRLKFASGHAAGVDLILVDSGAVRAAICPSRGMGLWKANIGGIPYGWNSAVEGPVHPMFVPLADPSGLGWLDGFDELLVRCGMQSFGAPEFDQNHQLKYGLHGRVGNLPARNLVVNLDAEHSLLEVTAEIHESRFLQFNYRLQVKYLFALDMPIIEVHDTLTNASAQPAVAQMLYHINVGQPILEENGRLDVSADRIVARNEHAAKDLSTWQVYRGPTPGYEEQVYFSSAKSTGDGWASSLLSTAAGDRGFAVHFATETLPYFTQWKNTVAESDGYVTGLEPGTGFPNPRSFEQEKGRALSLAGGESVDFHLKLEGINTQSRVQQLAAQIQSARAGAEAQTVEFDAAWCLPR